MAELPALVASGETSLAPCLAVPALPFDADLLAGQLADSSIAMYRRDFSAYVRYAATQALDPLQPATLARWRTTLAKETTLSPNTINRMLSAVKRLMAEAAEQGYLIPTCALRYNRERSSISRDREEQHGRCHTCRRASVRRRSGSSMET